VRLHAVAQTQTAGRRIAVPMHAVRRSHSCTQGRSSRRLYLCLYRRSCNRRRRCRCRRTGCWRSARHWRGSWCGRRCWWHWRWACRVRSGRGASGRGVLCVGGCRRVLFATHQLDALRWGSGGTHNSCCR
jgi:hypothetical protein